MKINFKNKKNFLYCFLITIFIATCSYTTFSIFSLNKDKKILVKKTENKENFKYLIKETEGKIKVFLIGNEKPIATLEKEFEYLPEYDQKMLKNGIFVENTEKLNKILEDYDD